VYILKIPKSELIIKEFFRARNKFSPFPRDRTFPIDGLKKVYYQIRPKMFNKHRAEQMTLKKERANLERIKKVIGWFNKFKSEEFDQKSKEIVRNYESLYNSDVGVVGVRSIKRLKKKEKVYDVSVENTESFFGNDYPVLLHNSGSKGFHIIVSGKAFPREFKGESMRESFPSWPRAICEYLMEDIRRDFNRKARDVLGDTEAVEKRTNVGKDKFMETLCPECGKPAKKGNLVTLKCPICNTEIQRKDMKITKKRLKCIQTTCAGILEVEDEKDYFECENCENVSSIDKMAVSGRYKATFTSHARESKHEDLEEEYSGSFFGASDLVLVAPRHLFRMPYSLHEKTALASIVLDRSELKDFTPKDADPLKVKVRDFMPKNFDGEGTRLLEMALEWKGKQIEQDKESEERRYKGYGEKKFEGIELKDVPESAFPPAIKKLLKGLEDGRKRALFVLLTFLRCINYSPEQINKLVKTWNEKNVPPLREGYVKSQIDWNLRQKRKILPPNYTNDAFYRDIGLIDKKQKTKNPLVDVSRKMRGSY